MSATSPASSTSAHAEILQRIAREPSGDVSFPTCLQAFEHIRKCLRDPSSDLERISLAVNQEPLIASRLLLRLANSARYSGSGPILRDTARAIGRLGINLVRTTALSIALDQMLKCTQLGACQPPAQQLWQQSLHTAALCRCLARETRLANPDEAMLLGLVHNIGSYYLLYQASQYPRYAHDEAALAELLGQAAQSVSIQLFRSLELPESLSQALTEQGSDWTSCRISELGYVLNMARARESKDTDPAPHIAQALAAHEDLRELAAAEYQALLQALA